MVLNIVYGDDMSYLVPQAATDAKIWTPGLSFGGLSTGITYSSRAGQWLRIGNTVYINGYFAITNKGSESGPAAITGLPIPSSSSITLANPVITVPLYSLITLLSSDYKPNAYLYGSATTVNLSQTNSITSSLINETNFSNTTQVNITMSYYV